MVGSTLHFVDLRTICRRLILKVGCHDLRKRLKKIRLPSCARRPCLGGVIVRWLLMPSRCKDGLCDISKVGKPRVCTNGLDSSAYGTAFLSIPLLRFDRRREVLLYVFFACLDGKSNVGMRHLHQLFRFFHMLLKNGGRAKRNRAFDNQSRLLWSRYGYFGRAPTRFKYVCHFLEC